MKKIEAAIKPFKVDDVRQALSAAGFQIVQIYEVNEFTDNSRQERVSGTQYPVDLQPRSILTILSEDKQLDQAIAIIKDHARSGNPDDGRILVSSVDNYIALTD